MGNSFTGCQCWTILVQHLHSIVPQCQPRDRFHCILTIECIWAKTIRLEAQTTDSLELQVDLRHPLQVSFSTRLLNHYDNLTTRDSYLNIDGNRTVTLNVYDAVGFEQESIQSYVWLEGVHDANGNGISEVNERILIEHEVINIGTSWQFSFQLNETGNAEGDAIQVYLEGTDRDGREILTDGQEQGHLYWTSRLPTKSTIVSVDERYPTENGVAPRLEPTKVSGWDVIVRDDNGLGDINTVRITLGGDDDLGLLYRSNEGCSSLDGRLAVTESCLGTIVGDELHIVFDFEVMWQMTSSGINIGDLQVRTYDEDGFTFYDDVNAGRLSEISPLQSIQWKTYRVMLNNRLQAL